MITRGARNGDTNGLGSFNFYTDIKKLIQLFAYLNEMVEGGIVFIDKFDSNIHASSPSSVAVRSRSFSARYISM